MKATDPIWQTTSPGASYPRLAKSDQVVDVAVIGAGITGATAAALLELSGRKVALLEARTVGSGVTGSTTAHLTQAIDTRYTELESKFGSVGARLVAESSAAAIELVEALSRRFGNPASLRRLPGYLYTERPDHVEELEAELEAARRAGVPVSPESPPLPLPILGSICFQDQAEVDPVAYVSGLARLVARGDSAVFENTRVVNVDEGEPCSVHLEDGTVLRATHVILATHAPLNRLLLQTKIAHYRSYVVSGPVEHAPDGLFWDTEDPYHYVRSFRTGGQTHLVVGGEDHKTGQEPDAERHFDELAEFAARLGLVKPDRRWSAQVIESVDGLPFIGRNAGSERVFVATGFSGNGMTFGTVAAMILSDACLGKENPYAELYRATRVKPLASLASYLGENVDFPVHLLSDKLKPPDATSLGEVGIGEGKIVRVAGERLAVFRDDQGRCHALSSVCTHLGCQVAFNSAERSWDCPCHGSRFDLEGQVLDGPAQRPLAPRSVDDDAEVA